MLSKNRIKYIRSLRLKKFRDEFNQFVCEGDKIISDLLNSGFQISEIYASESWAKTNMTILEKYKGELVISDIKSLSMISEFKSPSGVIAVADIPKYEMNFAGIKNKLTIVLENIQDPGNLGTIIRTADWFGIENIICSPNCADVFNSKVVQSSMGAVSRVRVHYAELSDFIDDYTNNCHLPVYGTFLKGDNIYNEKLENKGLVVFGNEGSGITKEIEKRISKKLFIPDFSDKNCCSESLNVAIATGIVCSEFRRRGA